MAVRLVAVGGALASGKSTVAERIARETSADLVGADATRKAVRDAGRSEAYLPGFSETLYPELLRKAEAALAVGRPVVLDGSFRSRQLRAAVRQLAAKHAAPFLFVECRADPALCRERLRRREREGGGEGWLEMFEHFLTLWEPVEEFPAAEHLVLDTSQPLEANLEIVRGALEAGGDNVRARSHGTGLKRGARCLGL